MWLLNIQKLFAKDFLNAYKDEATSS